MGTGELISVSSSAISQLCDMGTPLGFSVSEFSLVQGRQHTQCSDSGHRLWSQAALVHISALNVTVQTRLT